MRCRILKGEKMKKKAIKLCVPVLMFVLMLLKASLQQKEDKKIEESYEKNEIIVKKIKYKDKMWHTDRFSYKYKLQLIGRMKGTEEDIIFVVLTNNIKINFDEISERLLKGTVNENEEQFVLAKIKKI